MSVSRGCIIVELAERRWYCVVAHDEYDYDFTSGSTVYGPADGEEEAYRLMSDKNANPGQSETIPFGDVDERVRNIIHNSTKERSWRI